jgi:hypothetical protein
MTLLNILEKIGKQFDLDSDLQDAKTGLQTIQKKMTPYHCQIAPIISRRETVKEKLEGLDKHQLEDCKKALEELKEIVHLFPSEEHLLKEINDKLKILNLEEEIQQLQNQNSSTQTPKQKAEIQKKIKEKEKELKEVKKQSKSGENKQFQLSPQILSKFSSLSSFNTKEKMEALINPVKDNLEFLLEINAKYQTANLSTLLSTKSPKKIIVIIKRFEYEKDKDKKIKEYYGLKEKNNLTDEQINEYLYKEAIGEIYNSQQEKQNNLTSNNQNNNKTLIILTVGEVIVFLSILFFVIYKSYRNKRVKRKMSQRKNS